MAYDIGCGTGAMSLKLANAGCAVVACDIAPMLFSTAGEGVAIDFVAGDAGRVAWANYPMPDVLYSQRFLHFLAFTDAAELVQAVIRLSPECSVFLSMSGLHSELGEGYPDSPLPVRFARLSVPMRKKHGIETRVCLYSLADAEALAVACDLTIARIWTSPFGNIKLVARKRSPL